MSLFRPAARPRRFHIEVSVLQQRKQRLSETMKRAERALEKSRQNGSGEAEKEVEVNFSHLRGTFSPPARGLGWLIQPLWWMLPTLVLLLVAWWFLAEMG